ncbi:hypothetical protein [Phyllobacterium endophyticum]|uniref:hypothetical protein n=1 Tax=Phyllobacterium endophyticum TaxID=1149773 RepID=UPI0011CA8A2D|nr:hypothetical protein [Phyllobacterium endophyticum]TXR46606.1 hypothetical protein FVA77_24095 [Phyllobacterium endophyticum]
MNNRVEIIDKINLVRKHVCLIGMAAEAIDDRNHADALSEAVWIVQTSLKELKELAKDALASEDALNE